MARSWHWIGDVHDLTESGARTPMTLLPGCLDEPLVAVRDGDAVRLLSNVCPHRGNLVVLEPGGGNTLRCGYHGRRFGLDGRCRHQPAFDTAYDVRLHPHGAAQVGIAAEGEPTLELPVDHPEAGQRVFAWYQWLFPGLMLNVYPWGISLNAVQPLGPTRTRVRFRSYVWPGCVVDDLAAKRLHQTEMEDEAVVLSVQRGLSSRHYHRGRYAPSQEAGVHHFHRQWLAAMRAAHPKG